MNLNENEKKINLLIENIRKELDRLNNEYKFSSKIPELIASYCNQTTEDLTILESQVIYILEMFSSQHNMMLDNFEYVKDLENKLLKYES